MPEQDPKSAPALPSPDKGSATPEIKLGDAAPPPKPSATPAPEALPGTDIVSMIRKVVVEALKENKGDEPDEIIVPEPEPAPVALLPKVEDINRLWQEGKQGEVIAQTIGAVASATAADSARANRQQAFRELEHTFGDFYRRWTPLFDRFIKANRLNDSQLRSYTQAEQAFRFALAHNPKALRELAEWETKRGASAPAPSAPASAAGPAPTAGSEAGRLSDPGKPVPRVELPGAAPDVKGAGIVGPALSGDELEVARGLGLDEEAWNREKSRMKDPKLRRTADGLEI